MRFLSARIRRTDYEGTKQADKILRAARAVFAREGAAGFSARRVAKEAGLSLGSVQHVFPTSDALLVAMLESVITAYDERYREMVSRLPLSAKARWEAVIDFLVEDICRPDTRRLFFGFWALACHNRLASALLREAYDYHRGNLGAFVAAVRPDLDEDACRRVGTQVAALIEGSMLYTAAGPKAESTVELRATVKAGVAALVAAAQPTARTGAGSAEVPLSARGSRRTSAA